MKNRHPNPKPKSKWYFRNDEAKSSPLIVLGTVAGYVVYRATKGAAPKLMTIGDWYFQNVPENPIHPPANTQEGKL